MVIDFERAEIVKAIRKRKRLCGAKRAESKDNMVDMMKDCQRRGRGSGEEVFDAGE